MGINDIYKKIKYNTISTDLRFGDNNDNSNKLYLSNKSYLTDNLVEYICSFLMNDDVIRLKGVSKPCTLVCLREMRKIKINSFNMNKIENLQQFKDLISFKNV